MQLVLLDECGLGRVGDPARGAFYVESRTDALARAAWAVFQGIERQGGLTKQLVSGGVQRTLESCAESLSHSVSATDRALIGATHFPPETGARTPELTPLAGLDALEKARASALEMRGRIALGEVASAEHAVRAMEGDATFDELGKACLLYTSPSPRDQRGSRMPSSA